MKSIKVNGLNVSAAGAALVKKQTVRNNMDDVIKYNDIPSNERMTLKLVMVQGTTRKELEDYLSDRSANAAGLDKLCGRNIVLVFEGDYGINSFASIKTINKTKNGSSMAYALATEMAWFGFRGNLGNKGMDNFSLYLKCLEYFEEQVGKEIELMKVVSKKDPNFFDYIVGAEAIDAYLKANKASKDKKAE